MLSRIAHQGLVIYNASQLLKFQVSSSTIVSRPSLLRTLSTPEFDGRNDVKYRRFQVRAGRQRDDMFPFNNATHDRVRRRALELAETHKIEKGEYLNFELGFRQGLVMTNEDVNKELAEKRILDLAKEMKLDKEEHQNFEQGFWQGMSMIEGPKKTSKTSPFTYFIGTLIVCGVLYFVFRGAENMKLIMTAISAPDFKAEIPDVSFADVRGIDEVKGELQEVVQFLKHPDRFTSLGAKLPKGLLLVGPPGTGKTLLARAVAGEAGVPFYYAAGSEFDEMFVGVGSSRIRKLFGEARENSPCIIFIDEIDACGSARTSSAVAPYARVTINQLLQEMDGFETRQGIIVIGATNMGQVLDKALTRPGRFDTEIKVLPPDIKGRKEILELYASKIISAKDLDLQKIACLTGGMAGADLSNLVNQAALFAAQKGNTLVDMGDFEYALDKLRLGPELKTRLRTPTELKTTAFHEAGHALVAYYTQDSMPIFKVTISQRGHALGHTSLIPTQEDELNLTRAKIMWQIDVAMGGRVAEELLNGSSNVTTGASNDLDVATKLAYSLVCDFGMSESLGFVAFDLKNVSPDNKTIIEKEVNNILTASYNRAKTLLSNHSQQHELLSKALLKYETLSLDQIKDILNHNSIEALEKS